MLHLCSGDQGLAAWSEARLPGEALVWRDSPAVGPWHPDPATRWRLRAAFWGVPDPDALGREETAVLGALAGAEAVALWFTAEPWDQLILLRVVAALAGAGPLLEPVPVAGPGAMGAAFKGRRPLTEQDRREAAGLWERFEAEDWPALRVWGAQGRVLAGMAQLAPALARVLEDRPPHRPGRTERQVRELMAAGVGDLAGLMRALAKLENPYGVAWYGDRVVAGLMARR